MIEEDLPAFERKEPMQPELLKPFVEGSTNRLIKAIQDLSQAYSVDEIAKVVRNAARDVVKSDGATFVLLEREMCYYVEEDAIGPLWKGKRFPAETCISGWAMRNKQQVKVPDIYVDERIPHDAYRPTFVKSLVMTPVRVASPIAAIGTYWAINYDASEAECAYLQSLANMTSIALDNVKYIQELQSLNQDLEEKVLQRTEEVSKANEELRQLARVVSHELQQPLRMITSHLGMLNARYSGRLEADADEFIANVVTNAKTVERMLDSLWIYARVNGAAHGVERVDFNDLFDAGVFAVRDLVSSKEATITKIGTLPTLTANRTQLGYLLQQLFENAIIHGGGTQPMVELSAEHRDNEWIFVVKDKGRGFDMIDAQRIFEMFSKLDRQSSGSGMGLSICRKVIEAHGGRMWVQSEPERGSSFYFSLPA